MPKNTIKMIIKTFSSNFQSLLTLKNPWFFVGRKISAAWASNVPQLAPLWATNIYNWKHFFSKILENLLTGTVKISRFINTMNNI